MKTSLHFICILFKTENEFLFSNDEFAGNIFIGSGETHSIKIISEIIKSLNKDFPKIKFHIISGDSEDLLERLDKGLLDFCILIEPYNLDNYEYLDLNQKDVWGLLFRKDDKLAQKNFIKIEDLFNIPLLISRQVIKKSFDNNPILNWFGDNLDKLNIIGTYNLIYNAAVMTENKICCALGLDRLITDSIDSPLTFRPLFPIIEVKVSIVWKKNQIFSSPAKLFLKKLQDTLK